MNNIRTFLFNKKKNTSFREVPFKISSNDIGKIKYLPPVAKEWKNTVYSYNSNNTTNYPVYDLNINSLIKSYFNLYFNHKFLQHKYISRKRRRKSSNKIFVSKAQIKHTNSKAIITIFVYNREKLTLLRRIKKLKKIFVKLMVLLVNKNKWIKYLSSPYIFLKKDVLNNSNILWRLANHEVKNEFRKKDSFLYFRVKRLAKRLYQILIILRRYKLKLSLNKYKFEEKFLYKLSQLIRKYYGKKVEFHIVNVKSIAYNSDIFTEILTSKIKKEKTNPVRKMNALLSKVVLPKVNTIIERGRVEKNVDLELVDNKYKNVNISSIIYNDNLLKDSLNKLIYNLYYETIFERINKLNENSNISLKIRDIIFDNIKYKNMGGARLIVKGRLTQRYRADRALYKLKWKGGLKNIDSAFKGLSSVIFRGYMDSNVEKSRSSSKRRIGSFGVRSWFSGK